MFGFLDKCAGSALVLYLGLISGAGPAHAQSPSSAQSGSGTLNSSTAHGPVLSKPPVISEVDMGILESKLKSVNRSTPSPSLPLPKKVLLPSDPPTQVASVNGANAIGPKAPTDFSFQTIHQMTLSETSTATSAVGESSLGSMGNNTIFNTSNWFAAISNNGGASFTYVDPYHTFPSVNGGFCCDQSVQYAASKDMMVWALQYVKDANSGTLRIATAVGSANVSANFWTYYDFNPQNLGFALGNWMDFPNLTLGSTYLYVTSNVFKTSNNAFSGAVVFRIPLAQLAAGGTVNYDYFTTTTLGSWRCADGATTTMFCGTHLGGNLVRILRWDDGNPTVFWDDNQLSGFTYLTAGKATSPDGTNWAGDADSRILGSWVAGGVIGLMFSAQQDLTFPYPYTIVARFNQSNRALVSQNVIWNSTLAWLYPAVSVNAAGNLGGIIAYGGGSLYPNEAAWLSDDVHSAFAPLENYAATAGNRGPTGNRWGDFFNTRRHATSPNTWVGGAYDLRNGGGNSSVVQSFLWFGRNRDLPSTTPDLTIQKTHAGSFVQGQAGAAYTIAAKNIGTGPTSGTVSVTDTVPTGLSATSIAGSGWNCAQPAGPCSRSDALAVNGNYPAIILTVNVANNAPASVTNTASVSGGGETNTANNTSNDVTSITPQVLPPILTVGKTHAGNFTQGQTGATYTVTVSNAAGAGATSGQVQVTETVPAGLALIGMTGPAPWACVGNACVRSDVLNPGGSYPAIRVTVNVAANATSPQVNAVSVSGGGSSGANATDSTTIATGGTNLTITGPAALAAGNLNQAYPATTITASGGTGPYTWSATGLPSGLGIAAGTGIISGAPTTIVGSPFPVNVTVKDATSAMASKSYSLTVLSLPPSGVLLGLGNGSAAPGQTVEVPIQLTTQSGNAPAGFQADASFDQQKLSYVSARIGEQLTSAGKSLSVQVQPNNDVRFLGIGINQTTIPNGNIAYVTFKLNSQFTSGTTAVTLNNCQCTDAGSQALATTCAAGAITPGCTCDANGDGAVNVGDVQFIINQVLSGSASVCHSGSVNIADVQRVINSVLGLGCK